VIKGEPLQLAIIGTLMGRLEKEPSIHVCLFIKIGDGELAFGVVTSDVLEHSVTLPDGLVIIPIIDKNKNPSIGHEKDIEFALVFLFSEVKEMFLIGKPQLIKNDKNLEHVNPRFVVIDC